MKVALGDWLSYVNPTRSEAAAGPRVILPILKEGVEHEAELWHGELCVGKVTRLCLWDVFNANRSDRRTVGFYVSLTDLDTARAVYFGDRRRRRYRMKHLNYRLVFKGGARIRFAATAKRMGVHTLKDVGYIYFGHATEPVKLPESPSWRSRLFGVRTSA